MTCLPDPPYHPGDRVALAHTGDEHTTLVPGDQGTVTGWNNPFHQLDVAWDNGSTRMMILQPGADRVRLIDPAPPPADPAPPAAGGAAGRHGPAAPPPTTTPTTPAAPGNGPHAAVDVPAGLVLPPGLAARPVCPRRGLPIPFVNTAGPHGWTDFTSIDTPRTIEAGRTRICGLCALPHEYWLAFLGGPASARARAFADPPMHLACALTALELCPHIEARGFAFSEGSRSGNRRAGPWLRPS